MARARSPRRKGGRSPHGRSWSCVLSEEGQAHPAHASEVSGHGCPDRVCRAGSGETEGRGSSAGSRELEGGSRLPGEQTAFESTSVGAEEPEKGQEMRWEPEAQPALCVTLRAHTPPGHEPSRRSIHPMDSEASRCSYVSAGAFGSAKPPALDGFGRTFGFQLQQWWRRKQTWTG